ncbi:MAG: shikimate kinase [Candidatus Gracilibacteria bacterium]|nr:shikimate kinase [Candidatus Gracilibacteria bacterium]
MKSSIILIGAPGVGKTKLGAQVAATENYDFFDGDHALIEYILEKGEVHTSDPVAQKLIQLGDAAFLQYEHQFYLEYFPNGLQAETQVGVILSASGSMPLVPETVEHFKNTGSHIVWITRDTARIVQNCKKRVDGVTRIVGMEAHGTLDAVLAHRKEIYRNCADSILDLGSIDTKTESIEAIAAHLKKIG